MRTKRIHAALGFTFALFPPIILFSPASVSAKVACVESVSGGCATVIGREAPAFRFFQVRISATSTPSENFALFPKTLSATGFFSDIAAKTVGPGAYAYEINSPLWRDGARASRYLVLPADSAVTYVNDSDAFAFPDGAVLVKNLTMDTVEGNAASRIFVETQLMIYRDQLWYGFSYRWRADQSDADLVGGDTGGWREDTLSVRTAKELSRKKRWMFAARSPHDFQGGSGRAYVSCSSCHGVVTLPAAPYVSVGMGRALGFRTPQLRRPLDGMGGKDQIRDMLDQGYLVERAGAAYDAATAHRWFALEDSSSPGSTLEKRVRSYLAANCSHCHGPVPALGEVFGFGLDLRYVTPNASTAYVNMPSKGLWGLNVPASDTAKWINPGKPEYSTLLRRISAADSSGYRDTTNWGLYGGEAARLRPLAKTEGWAGTGMAQMPPLATYEPNPAADRAIYAWIKGLAAPSGVRKPASAPPAVPGKIRLTRGLLYLPENMTNITNAILADAKGRRTVLRASRPGVFRLPAGLGNGVYCVAAGGRRFALAWFPVR